MWPPAILNSVSNIYDSGTSKPVVQELVVAIEQCPEYSAAKQGDTDYCKQVARDCLLQVNSLASGGGQPQFPGLHRQSLSTMGPEPDEISAHHQ